MAENFPNLKNETDIQVQETQRVPNKMNPNRPTPRHFIIKMAEVKDKESILKAAREKQIVSDKGTHIRLSAYLCTKMLQARRKWQYIHKVLKRKNLQPRKIYTARLSFRTVREIKNLSDKQKLRNIAILNIS